MMAARMTIALLALVNVLVATYLHLWKIGKVGSLRCASGQGCLVAQFSSYGSFLGVDVALLGAVFYTALLVAALVSLGLNWVGQRKGTLLLLALVVPGFLFTLRLKYGEWIVLRTFCSWCFISTVSITVCLVLLFWEWRRLSRPGEPIASRQ